MNCITLWGGAEKGYELDGNWGRRGKVKPDQVMQDF